MIEFKLLELKKKKLPKKFDMYKVTICPYYVFYGTTLLTNSFHLHDLLLGLVIHREDSHLGEDQKDREKDPMITIIPHYFQAGFVCLFVCLFK